MIDLRIIDRLAAVDIDRLSHEELHQWLATVLAVHGALVDELRKPSTGDGLSPPVAEVVGQRVSSSLSLHCSHAPERNLWGGAALAPSSKVELLPDRSCALGLSGSPCATFPTEVFK
jgi:hypothetical protein